MIIRHIHTNVFKEITLAEWDDNYVGKGIDSQFVVTKIDPVGRLYSIDAEGNRTMMSRFEKTAANYLMRRRPQGYFYEPCAFLEAPARPLEIPALKPNLKTRTVSIIKRTVRMILSVVAVKENDSMARKIIVNIITWGLLAVIAFFIWKYTGVKLSP